MLRRLGEGLEKVVAPRCRALVGVVPGGIDQQPLPVDIRGVVRVVHGGGGQEQAGDVRQTAQQQHRACIPVAHGDPVLKDTHGGVGGKAAPAVGGGLNHPVVNGRDLFGVGHTVADDAGKHRLGRRLQCGVVHRFGVDAEIGDIAAVPLLRQLEIAGDNGRNQRQDGGKVGAPVGRGIQRQAASRVVGLDEALGDEGLIAAGSRRRQQQAGQSNRQRQNKGKDFFHDRLLL